MPVVIYCSWNLWVDKISILLAQAQKLISFHRSFQLEVLNTPPFQNEFIPDSSKGRSVAVQVGYLKSILRGIEVFFTGARCASACWDRVAEIKGGIVSMILKVVQLEQRRISPSEVLPLIELVSPGSAESLFLLHGFITKSFRCKEI